MPYPDSASPCCSRASSTSTKHRTHRARRSKRHLSPSPSVLSLLAVVVADTCGANAAPAPLPLPFLYPTLHSASSSIPENDVLTSTNQNRTKKRRHTRTFFPDKYVQGEDGRWRKTETFTFNGYAFGGQIETCGKTAMDAAATSPTSTVSSVALAPTPTCTNGSDFKECLPNGWKLKDRNDRSSLILTISLVLAFFICFFIIGCLLWRKSMRRMRDVEQRRHRRRRRKAARQGQEEARSMLEKELKTKKKIWANATARWKINAHYMAWRRRGKRTNIDFSTPQALTPSRPTSPAHSRRTSTQVSRVSTPEPSDLSSRQHPLSEQDRLSPPQPPSTPLTPTSSILPSMSPPAYQHPGSSMHAPGYSVQQSSTSSKSRTPLEGTISSSPSTCDVTTTAEADIEIPYTSSFGSGHVATDDKAFLERLTYQASSPPVEEGSSTSAHQISVPVWRDEDFPPEDDEEISRPSTTVHLFPPPPIPSLSEKGKMAMFYDSTFEEGREGEGRSIVMNMLQSEPAREGSAPPFEEAETEPLASAPPLAHDDGDDELEYLDLPEPDSNTWSGRNAGEASATPNPLPPSQHSAERERRDSSLQQLGLDFEVIGASGNNTDSLPQDLPVYRP